LKMAKKHRTVVSTTVLMLMTSRAATPFVVSTVVLRAEMGRSWLQGKPGRLAAGP